ncbi:MAG: hypothetical protein ACOVRN_03780, partial [Flavobacterium sp.]
KADDFLQQTEWTAKYDGKKYCIQVFAKDDGRANSENKYEFPPPVDSDLYFGKCVLVNSGGNITVAEWGRIYENLYGGFDDIGADDSDEDDDDMDDVPLTKTGYMKDDFVVDDDELDDEVESEEEEEEIQSEVESSDEDTKKSKSKAKSKSKKKISLKPKATRNKAAAPEPAYLDCTSELIEEDYI